MSSNINCGCMSSRAMAMTVGVASAILWLPLLSPVLNSYRYLSILRDPGSAAAFLLILTASAMSILMVVGASKRNASYMAPWLAIHFVTILFGAASSISMFVVAIADHYYPYFIQFGIMLPLTGLLAFLWSCVYLHHKGLMNAAVQENATCANEGKIYKCPKGAEAADVLYCHI